MQEKKIIIDKDTDIVDFDGLAVKDIQKTIDSNGQVKIIETHKLPPFGRGGNPAMIFGPLFFFLAIVIVFLGWYYLKKKSEIARLMIQNSMSPAELFRRPDGNKSLWSFMRLGILFVALGLGLLINKLLLSVGLHRYMLPVLCLSVGIALLIIHRSSKD